MNENISLEKFMKSMKKDIIFTKINKENTDDRSNFHEDNFYNQDMSDSSNDEEPITRNPKNLPNSDEEE